MGNTYSITEARGRLAELLRRVQAGESVTITCRGEPVAELHPARPAAPASNTPDSPGAESEETSIEELRRRGILVRNGAPDGKFAPQPAADRPGALQRFLTERGQAGDEIQPEATATGDAEGQESPTIEEILDDLRRKGQLGEAYFPGMPLTPGPHTIPGALQRFLDERG